MKKIVDDPRLIYRCCRMYYEERMEQQRIADALAVSRTTVSKMLQAGREMGIVRIEVVLPENCTVTAMEEHLMNLFHLKEVVVVEDSPFRSREEFRQEISQRALQLIRNHIHEGDVVGVSMGKTLLEISHVESGEIEPVDCTFVPILGGIATGSVFSENINANRVAAEMAEAFGGEYVEFFSPALFSDRHVMEEFLKEAPIQRVTRMYRRMRTVVMGIGIPNRGGSSMVKAGFITSSQLDEMVERGMVGDLSLQFFDSQGREDAFEDFNRRVAGMPLREILNVENRITVAMRGISQARALYAAIEGGYTNIVVLDQKCAAQLAAWKEEAN